MAKLDLTGMKFNKLTVVKEVGSDSNNQILWLCMCDCGRETVATAYRINREITKSCGCLISEKATIQAQRLKNLNSTHGLSKTRIYKIYHGIRERCCNQNDMHYQYYGGRGISVCKEWEEDFLVFYDWAMENGYSEGLSIDRIDVNGNYEPNNCRWSSHKTQSNNKRNNRYIQYNGIIKTLSEWAEEYGINRGTLSARIDRYGMSFEEAILIPGGHCKPRKMYKVTNIEDDSCVICTRKEISQKINIGLSTIRHYLNKDRLWKDIYKISTYEQ